MTKSTLLQWLPQLDRPIWILSGGRLLSQIGNGFTLVYAPIFFANQVGLSATVVGLGLGLGSVAGVLGRFLGGTGADSPDWGRRSILLWSAAISAVADVALAIATNFPLFILGNILMGFGIGLYWPATEAMVADLTSDEQRNEAFALVRWADQVGLSLGIILGGVLIELTGMYRLLFIIDGITYVGFFGLIYVAIAETLSPTESEPQLLQGWGVALRDRRLQLYVIINSLLTLYVAQVQSTLPLYFTRFVTVGDNATWLPMAIAQSTTAATHSPTPGFSTTLISALFAWNIVLMALLQLPIARWLNRFSRPHALILSALTWGIGFCGIFITGTVTSGAFWWAGIALALMAVATVMYLPAASGFVVDIAPPALRGIYLSVNSQCWAIGYFIGPSFGGWALDQGRAIAHTFWLVLAGTIAVVIAILMVLTRWDAQHLHE
ncbi:MAG: MFS transporter [Cyanothece sp. SIO2G6]|nr:MFS transporter [Cyanothece sp. SIO2G6]